MSKCTGKRRRGHKAGSEPWRSWASTVRYLMVRLAQAVPCGVLVWLAYMHHFVWLAYTNR